METLSEKTEFLTPEDVAARYKGKISVRTLQNWRVGDTEIRGPKYVRIGNRVLYPLPAFLEWEASRLRERG